MAGANPAGDHPLHPRGVLTYALTPIAGGPWPGRLALGPMPVGARDLADIKEWDPVLVLSLVEDGEAARDGLSPLETAFAGARLTCVRAPIRDFGAPGESFLLDWETNRHRAVEALENGGKVLCHCRAGRGRSGMVAAALLVAGGLPPDEAIRLVRTARPGAVETPGQEDWVRASRQ